MGHIVAKEYKKLGKTIDSLSVRVALNDTFYEILKKLYTPEEADFLVKMPYSFSSFNKIKQVTKYDEKKVKKLLNSLCGKGLVMDIASRGKNYYMISPMVIGIFEFTMMRTGSDFDVKKLSKLFYSYMVEDDSFFSKNFQNGETSTFMRTIPHNEAIDENFTEILSYENALEIVEQAKKISIGICSCRHEKLHLDKVCKAPLDTCTSFDKSADFLIRKNLSREVSKEEMKEKLIRSREAGLVFNGDNVQKNFSYICHCCKCCCHLFTGFNKHGLSNVVVSSNYIAKTDEEKCIGCGLCEIVCPANAIKMVEDENGKKKPVVDENFCLGCGVCNVKCKEKAITLFPKEKRVIPPESALERIILQCLERNTLQYQLFDDPNKMTHKFARVMVGSFLKLSPVKKALMSDSLRSRFFNFLKGKR